VIQKHMRKQGIRKRRTKLMLNRPIFQTIKSSITCQTIGDAVDYVHQRNE